MKKKQLLHGMMLLLSMSVVSCSQGFKEETDLQSGYGLLNFTLAEEVKFGNQTRALNESSYSSLENYTVVVLDKDETEKLNCKYSEVSSKMPITLPIGSYTIKAYYGNEHAYSRNEFYVYGENQGIIIADQKSPIAVSCAPTCGKVSVNFAQEMSNYFSDYKVFFKGTDAMGTDSIEWKSSDTEPWYIKLAEEGEDVSFSICVTTKDEFMNSNSKKEAVKTGSFKLKRNKAFKMNINPSYTPTGEGNLDISITIDESTNDKEIDYEVPATWL